MTRLVKNISDNSWMLSTYKPLKIRTAKGTRNAHVQFGEREKPGDKIHRNIYHIMYYHVYINTSKISLESNR